MPFRGRIPWVCVLLAVILVSSLRGFPFPVSSAGEHPEEAGCSGEASSALGCAGRLDGGLGSSLKPVRSPGPADGGASDPLEGNATWKTAESWVNESVAEPFSVHPGPGRMVQEYLNFTSIRSLPITVVGENDSTDSVKGFYSPPETSRAYMSFVGDPYYSVVVDGAWIYVTGDTGGLVNFTIYNATYNAVKGYYQPNASVYEPCGYVEVSNTSENRWIWLDFEDSRATFSPSQTEDGVLFIAVWRGNDTTTLEWAYQSDTSTGDEEDEGAAFQDYWGLTYLYWDFYVNVTLLSPLQAPSPSAVNMMVNGTWPVSDGAGPGTGYWSHEVEVELGADDGRCYNVTVRWPGRRQWPVIFNVTFTGSFSQPLTWSTAYEVSPSSTTVLWNATVTVEYPAVSLDRRLTAWEHTGWTVQNVSCDGAPHADWASSDSVLEIGGASNGTWLVEALAPNYMAGLEVRTWYSNRVATEANISETMRIIAYLRTPSGLNLTPTVDGELWVDDPDGAECYNGVSYHLQPGAILFSWCIVNTTSKLGVFTLTAWWMNGTAVGLNETVLTVLPTMTGLEVLHVKPQPGGEVPRGQRVEIRLHYFYYYYDEQVDLSSATVEVLNASAGEVWPGAEYSPLADGGYDVSIPTNNVTVGVPQNVTIRLSFPLYREQSYNTSFTVIRRITRLLPLEGKGAIPHDGKWYASPQPYVNDTLLVYFNFTDSHDLPLLEAKITAELWYNETYRRSLLCEDLSGPPHNMKGVYRVTVDTSPIEGFALHAGDNLTLRVEASKEGYEPATAPPILIQLRPRIAYMEIGEEYEHLQLFSGWNYRIPFRLVMRDNVTGADITCANVTAQVPGLFSCVLRLATPNLGLYEIASLDTTGFPNGTYTMTLHATAADYLPCTRNVTLTILPKQPILYHVEGQIQPFYLVGTQLQLVVRFFFPDQTPLPQGTSVKLEVEISASGAAFTMETVFLSLDGEGRISYTLILSEEAVYSFRLTIAESEEYGGLEGVRVTLPDGSPLLLQVLSPSTLTVITLRSIAPWLILTVALAISSPLAYYRLVYLPRRRSRLRQLKAVAETFSDAANMIRLLVIYKESGACIFDPFPKRIGEGIDATLMAGFLHAISTFGLDLAEQSLAEEGEEGKLREEASLRELTYKGFHILVHEGDYTRTALILRGEPSQQLRSKIEQFTARFEERFHRELEEWRGRVDQFEEAINLVEEVFQPSLTLPHQVQPQPPEGLRLTELENRLYQIAREVGRDGRGVLLSQILNTYLAASGKGELEAINAIYQLRRKGLLLPQPVEPEEREQPSESEETKTE